MQAIRKYFIGGNWKCNGSLSFVKEHIEKVINPLEFSSNKLGKSYKNLIICIEVCIAPVSLHLGLA